MEERCSSSCLVFAQIDGNALRAEQDPEGGDDPGCQRSRLLQDDLDHLTRVTAQHTATDLPEVADQALDPILRESQMMGRAQAIIDAARVAP